MALTKEQIAQRIAEELHDGYYHFQHDKLPDFGKENFWFL